MVHLRPAVFRASDNVAAEVKRYRGAMLHAGGKDPPPLRFGGVGEDDIMIGIKIRIMAQMVVKQEFHAVRRQSSRAALCPPQRPGRRECPLRSGPDSRQ